MDGRAGNYQPKTTLYMFCIAKRCTRVEDARKGMENKVKFYPSSSHQDKPKTDERKVKKHEDRCMNTKSEVITTNR
jgi:hypothetical protein